MSQHIVCVVGNPNCGKTTFFNALTGSRQRVGNWPGVTVDKKTGNFEYKDAKIELVDLPGIYSITPAASSGEDERVARDYILSGAHRNARSDDRRREHARHRQAAPHGNPPR